MLRDKDQRKESREFLSSPDESRGTADQADFVQVADADRRGFLKGAGLATLGAMLGTAIPFGRNLPAGFVPAAFAQDDVLPGKDGLTLLSDRPVQAETPPHLLDAPITPNDRFFVLNNGLMPENTSPDGWELTIDGMVDTPLTLTIDDLKEQFDVVTIALVIECAGNGRAFFEPPAGGNQWTYGAVGCAEFTGVRLRQVLEKAGVKDGAVYTANEGADSHLSRDPERMALSRGLPIEKALTDDVLIAFEMNGTAIPPINGAPLRLVVGGYPGSTSQKWLTRIWLRDVVHDGARMNGTAYRMPNRPIAPGEEVAVEDFEIIERMPVKSLITNPATGTDLTDRSVEVRGHAWSGDRSIETVDISIDFGATWMTTELDPPVNSGAWQNWKKTVTFPMAGYYEVWSRATDSAGVSQPFAIVWNPEGYLNNTVHRIGLRVA